jgi:hypothetical protein
MRGDALEPDPELEELRHQLDAAFAGIHPRPGFRDELRGRLQRRRPWWHGLLTGPARWPLAGGAVAVLVVAALLVSQLNHPPSHPVTTSGTAGSAYSRSSGVPASRVSGAGPNRIYPAQLCASPSPEASAGASPSVSRTPALGGLGATPEPTCTPAGR